MIGVNRCYLNLFLLIHEVPCVHRDKLINDANAKITLLQRAIKYNVATDTEKQLLEQLELFTINVSRIDTSNINVVFPEMPE